MKCMSTIASQRQGLLNKRFQDRCVHIFCHRRASDENTVSQLFEEAYRLKLFWIAYDYLYEKAEQEAKERAQQPIMRQVQNRLEVVSVQLTRRLTLTLSDMRSTNAR